MRVDKLKESIDQQQKQYLEDGTVFVVSVSMGVDSAVLLELLHQLQYHLHIVHFNHHKRLESEEEARALCVYCTLRDIPFTLIDVPSFKTNFQNEARQYRYEQLEQIALQYQHSVIVSGHHLDDQIETYMHRVLSGSSVINRGGMQIYEKRGQVAYFRPLLHVEKADLYEIAKQMNVVFFEDVSNSQNIYTRNHMRNRILPMIEEVYPSYKRQLQADIREAFELQDYFHFEVDQYLSRYSVKKEMSFIIDRPSFLQQHPYMQKVILERCIKQLGFSLKRNRYEEMCAIIESGSGSRLLKRDYWLDVLHAHFRISFQVNRGEENSKYHFFLNEGFERLPKQYCMWYNNEYNNSNDSIEIHAEDLPFLVVRSYHQTDQIRIGIAHKRVQRLFIDKKLERYKRSSYPIVEDVRTKQIIWIPRLYKQYKRDKDKQTIQIYFKDGGFHA